MGLIRGGLRKTTMMTSSVSKNSLKSIISSARAAALPSKATLGSTLSVGAWLVLTVLAEAILLAADKRAPEVAALGKEVFRRR